MIIITTTEIITKIMLIINVTNQNTSSKNEIKVSIFVGLHILATSFVRHLSYASLFPKISCEDSSASFKKKSKRIISVVTSISSLVVARWP